MFDSVLNKLCKMILLSHMGQFCLGTRRLILATSQIGQSFLGTNQVFHH